MKASILIGLLTVAIAAMADEEPSFAPAGEMRASLAVKVDQKQIAGVPVIFELTITNSGTKAFACWCGGPDKYPPADWFEAVIIDEAGKERRVPMSNGQYHMGSGGAIKIEAGKSSKLPAAIEGLPAGKYTIKAIVGEAQGYFPNPKLAMIATWPAMEWKEGQKFEVKDDAEGAARFAKDLLKQVRAGQPFAKHVATDYTIQVVIDAMFGDLESADPEVVTQASRTVYRLGEFPKGFGAVIRRAMSKQLSVESPSGDATAMLASLAEREGSDDSLEAVLAYIDSGMQREWSMQNLFNFKQEKAAARLRELLKAKEDSIRLRAAIGLSKRHDPSAIPVLIDAARAKGNNYRGDVFYPLSDYWDDERAMAVLREAAADPDESVRRDAATALKNAEQEREYALKQAGKK